MIDSIDTLTYDLDKIARYQADPRYDYNSQLQPIDTSRPRRGASQRHCDLVARCAFRPCPYRRHLVYLEEEAQPLSTQ